MILRDPVHGLLEFEGNEAAIVPRLLEAREVQRLRRIRQLGLTSLAFPGAEHSRFSHALGAAHVMRLLLARLRQLDGDLPFWQRVTSERARDAIAAAFLHDIGHGPLSHLFETAMPGASHHEAWTERILLDPSSDVHSILVQHDPYLPQRVAELIRGKHELPYLARAVSGTFDVDRCDYLLRDAHATGVRYGDYDLPWLLRSLRFSEIPGGNAAATLPEQRGAGERGRDAPTLAIEGAKGLSAIESFLLARCFMFQQVYFHKSTRAAEWMIGAILRRVVERLREGERIPQVPAAIAAAAVGEVPSLSQYLELDDHVLLGAIHAWEGASDPILADLARRLRARALFKTLELYPEAGQDSPGMPGAGMGVPEEVAQAAVATARDIARAAGLDPDVYVGLDVAEDTPYEEDASLFVVFPQGRPRRPAEVSFLLDRLRNATLTRTRLLFAPELRDAVREALFR
ncbi:HD domain-containing protein [Chondromyces apiculatus]|uniref:Deoxyguanosinetriphosphate triphosphohydrolase n=1 Tax=Chondromyces apiculatus DSM 436 TaxID=1192034 RepID=A0A017TFC6_9BACT|nr:HD domain-containing protein [Chondromyces apiculatus]EYF07597.1 Deoxyguanosinetriphosphate triphosphohydrolase [Chondromyces apiculatus DSM 436]